MVAVSLRRPPFAPIERRKRAVCKKRSQLGQTQRQGSGTGHVANCSCSVLPKSDNSTHASVNVSLASLIRLFRLAGDPDCGAAGQTSATKDSPPSSELLLERT